MVMTMDRLHRVLSIVVFTALIAGIVFFTGCTTSPTTTEKPNLNLYVAAGMKKPMDVIVDKYKAGSTGNVTPNYGPSGGLYTQITLGQPCDLYYSADWMYIEKLQNESRTSEVHKFLKDYIVMVVSKTGKEKGITSTADLTGDGVVIAVADPAAPVGAYAENALKSLGLWDQLNAMGNIKTRPNTVNQLALMVQNDEVDVGFVYSSTANLYGLDVVEKFSHDQTGEIVFGAAVIKGGNEAAAKDFLAFSTQNAGEFIAYGWEPYA
ncbi:MAG: molybdate transporter periplasmic protein [Methanoregulaceae archaeon PtaB.Bin009]|nr:MAG: molybdate transporter periplasmic protein [Methanoregulaceae archaeon PtaB.Bin009]OPY42115.1 MAG: molybdate transporter periplasmic protein [Methanoregulaceae archaeon PtaU1.Bin066]